MARFETHEDEMYARQFMYDLGMNVCYANGHMIGDREYFDVEIHTPKGRVIFSDYSPSPMIEHEDSGIYVLSDLCAFAYHCTEYTREEWADEYDGDVEHWDSMMGRIEVLESLTGTDIESLSGTFATY